MTRRKAASTNSLMGRSETNIEIDRRSNSFLVLWREILVRSVLSCCTGDCADGWGATTEKLHFPTSGDSVFSAIVCSVNGGKAHGCWMDAYSGDSVGFNWRILDDSNSTVDSELLPGVSGEASDKVKDGGTETYCAGSSSWAWGLSPAVFSSNDSDKPNPEDCIAWVLCRNTGSAALLCRLEAMNVNFENTHFLERK